MKRPAWKKKFATHITGIPSIYKQPPKIHKNTKNNPTKKKKKKRELTGTSQKDIQVNEP